MDNITYRTNFLEKSETELEPDLKVSECVVGSLNFGDYDFGDNQQYMIHGREIGRPDLISQNIYHTTNYWWFLMWYNGVSDVWNDLREGMVINYPDINKVREAFKYYYNK